MTGRLDHLPVAEVAAHRQTRDQLAVDAQRPRLPRALAAALLDPAPQRLLRHPALVRDLDPPQQRPLGVGGRVVRVVRVQPHLAARPLATGGAWPQWSTCAWVHTTSRTCSTRSPTWSSARSRCAIDPGSCIPVSTSTTPSPAASAHALQCGTPGHGSGSRRRHTPGSTRSPRPPPGSVSVCARSGTVTWRRPWTRSTDKPPGCDGPPAQDQGAERRVLLAGRRRARRCAARCRPGRGASTRTTLAGSPLSREDAWHRGVEFLFERLAVGWAIAGTEPITSQKELLERFRMASQAERAWIRDVLREHVAEHFPDLAPP